jgi:hypothetical protein
MKSRDFVNWLSGYLDALGVLTPSTSDVDLIKEKIKEVQDLEFSDSIFPLHRIPSSNYDAGIPPFAGTTVSWEFKSTENNQELSDDVAQKGDSKI